MIRICILCNKERAIVKRPKTGQQVCRECFYYIFETEIHNTIIDNKLFKKDDKVAIIASGVIYFFFFFFFFFIYFFFFFIIIKNILFINIKYFYLYLLY